MSSILTCSIQTFTKQDPEFCFNNFILVSPFSLPIEKVSALHVPGLGCGICLVPGTPRRCVSQQMSLYAAFPALRLSPYLAWLDKGCLMVLLRLLWFRGQKSIADAGRSYELLSNK